MPGRLLANTLLAFVIALVVAGCGSEDGTIPRSDAQQLLAQLDAVEQSVAAGDCEGAQGRAQDLVELINALPASVGVETKEAMRSAATNLSTLAARECEPAEEETTEPETTDETTEPETTTTTTEETTQTEEETTEPEQPEDAGPGGGEDGGEDGGPGGEPPSGGIGGGGVAPRR